MTKLLREEFCSIPAAIKALWCDDPVLSKEICGDKFYEYGYSSSEKKPPYAVYRQGQLSNDLILGDDAYFGSVTASLKIYAASNIWRLSKQARILFSNNWELNSLEGSVTKIRCRPGSVMQLPGGIWLAQHSLQLSVIEYRGPERLRMN